MRRQLARRGFCLSCRYRCEGNFDTGINARRPSGIDNRSARLVRLCPDGLRYRRSRFGKSAVRIDSPLTWCGIAECRLRQRETG